MVKEKRISKIIISFCIFTVLFIINLMIPTGGNITHTSRMWLILDVSVSFISIFLIAKNKFPAKPRLILSFFLGLLMFPAYQGINFSSIKGFITVTLCSIASFSVFEKYRKHAIVLTKRTNLGSIVCSAILGVGIGVIWGSINLFLSGQVLNIQFDISYFLTALSPAILEEICYRFLIFAFCLSLLRGEIKNKWENFWCYFMMIMPHVLIHTPETFLTVGILSGTLNVILLALIFGIPFAILQRKRDLFSAMVAHGTVDIIQFSFLGLPF